MRFPETFLLGWQQCLLKSKTALSGPNIIQEWQATSREGFSQASHQNETNPKKRKGMKQILVHSHICWVQMQSAI